MSAKSQIDNFIKTYPEAKIDARYGNVYILNQPHNAFTFYVTIHVNFPTTPAYFRVSPPVNKPFVEANGNLAYGIFSYLGISPSTDLSLTVQSILNYLAPFYSLQSCILPSSTSVHAYNPKSRVQSFDSEIKMTLTPKTQQINVNDCLLPSNILYDEINTSLCTPEELQHLIAYPTETGIIFKHVRPFSLYYDKYVFLRHQYFHTNLKNIKLIEEIKQLQNKIKQVQSEIDSKIQQYNAYTVNNNQQHISANQQCNYINNQEKENCSYIIKQISPDMSDSAIKNLFDQFLEHSISYNRNKVLQQLIQ